MSNRIDVDSLTGFFIRRRKNVEKALKNRRRNMSKYRRRQFDCARWGGKRVPPSDVIW